VHSRCLLTRWLAHAGEELTVIINTFKRLDLLERAVKHYSQCPVVRRIHVNWAESTTPPELSSSTCCNTHVTFALPLATHNDSSLNTRFLPIPGAPRTLLRCALLHNQCQGSTGCPIVRLERGHTRPRCMPQQPTLTCRLAADLQTEAVLNIDDDITVACNTLLRTYQVSLQPCRGGVRAPPRHV
jgi:hypothetical protein